MARFGLVGDLHGKVGWLRLAFEAFERVGGVDAVLQVGDFGIDWPRAHKDPFLVGDQTEHLARQYNSRSRVDAARRHHDLPRRAHNRSWGSHEQRQKHQVGI